MSKFLSVLLTIFSSSSYAAEAAVSPSGGVLKMLLGLVIVLAVMAGLAWLLKRMLPGVSGSQAVVKIIGGVSVGSRERVVVVEVADRWIVVGVAPGQVHALADMEAKAIPASDLLQTEVHNGTQPALVGQPFAQWLKKSLNKVVEKPDAAK